MFSGRRKGGSERWEEEEEGEEEGKRGVLDHRTAADDVMG